MTKPKPILIVQGAQWGSEAKGMVAAALCERRHVHYAVRTGAVNAGHTVYKDGKRYVMQQLPTGWTSGCGLVIGPGAYVNPAILEYELNMIRSAGYKGLVRIDHRAGLHLSEHTERAGLSGRHYTIGATGKGCSEAIIDRIRLRGKDGQLFKDWCNENHPPDRINNFVFEDTADFLNSVYDVGAQILLEGTQGTFLDLYLGPYPYTTHKQCTASQWVTEAGLSPGLEYEVVLVARTYPIRVAGNSGPMPQEIDWPTLAFEINERMREKYYAEHGNYDGKWWLVNPVAVDEFATIKNSFPLTRYASPEVWLSDSNRDAWNQCTPGTRAELSKLFEFTTVTKKLRRIARLDMDTLKYSVMVNRPSWLCVTFANYEFPDLWGATATEHRPLYEYLLTIEKATGVPVRAFTTGPESHHFLERWSEVQPLSSSTTA